MGGAGAAAAAILVVALAAPGAAAVTDPPARHVDARAARTCAAPLTEASARAGRAAADRLLDVGAARLAADRFPRDRFPETAAPGGAWRLRGAAAWTSGFEPAARWLVAGARPSAATLAAARARSTSLPVAARSASHDVGFMAGWPAALAARLDPSPAGRAGALAVVARAARSLDAHWVPGVGGYWSWAREPRTTVIVDSLVSIRAVWAAQRLGVATATEVAHAHRHALLVARTHVRADGSTFHVVDLDPATGAVLARRTAQGWRDGSTWARGQAWAILGFAEAYRATGDRVLLAAARRTAGYWLRRVPPGCVPPVDFDAPTPVGPDTSAAAVAAVGLEVLAAADPDPAASRRWQRTAVATVDALAAPPWLARTGPALLTGGAVAWTPTPHPLATIYGDTYTLEAATRLSFKGPLRRF